MNFFISLSLSLSIYLSIYQESDRQTLISEAIFLSIYAVIR